MPLRSALVIRTALLAATAALLLLTVSHLERARYLDATMEPPPAMAGAGLPSGEALRVLSLGHHEALASLLWVDALSLYGQHRGARRMDRWLRPYLLAVSTLDPQFELIWEWAATVAMYGGVIDNASVLESIAILEEGVERFPASWTLHFQLGFNLLYELQVEDPDERMRTRQRGTFILDRASRMQGAPDWIRSTANTWLRSQSMWASVQSGQHELLLTSTDRSLLRAARSRLEHALGTRWAALPWSDRAIQRLASDHSPWTTSGMHLMILHPDPAFLVQPSALVPPPLALTF
jgi:hypothetical protein